MNRAVSIGLGGVRGVASLATALVLVLGLAGTICAQRAVAADAYKGFPVGQCTYYAAQEFDKVAPAPGVNWHGNAGAWYTNAFRAGWAETKDPDEAVPGSIVVWSGDSWGHVAVLREVTPDAIRIEEMNWGAWVDKANAITVNHNKVTSRTIKRADLAKSTTFQGFILPMTLTEKLRADAEKQADAVADKVAEKVEQKTDEALDQVGNAVEEETTRQLNGICGGPAALLAVPLLGVALAAKRRGR